MIQFQMQSIPQMSYFDLLLRGPLDYIAKVCHNLYDLSWGDVEVVLGMASFICIHARESQSPRPALNTM